MDTTDSSKSFQRQCMHPSASGHFYGLSLRLRTAGFDPLARESNVGDGEGALHNRHVVSGRTTLDFIGKPVHRAPPSCWRHLDREVVSRLRVNVCQKDSRAWITNLVPSWRCHTPQCMCPPGRRSYCTPSVLLMSFDTMAVPSDTRAVNDKHLLAHIIFGRLYSPRSVGVLCVNVCLSMNTRLVASCTQSSDLILSPVDVLSERA